MLQSNVCGRVVAVCYQRFENRARGGRSRQVEQDRAGVCTHAVIDLELFILGNTACFGLPQILADDESFNGAGKEKLSARRIGDQRAVADIDTNALRSRELFELSEVLL